VKQLGADYVINHHNRLVDELKKIGCHEVDYVFNCYKMTKDYFQQFADVTKPYGKVLGVINAEELDLNLFMKKSISFVQEYMALRQLAGIDIERNGMVLNEVRMLVDSKVIQSTVTEVFQFNLENLREAETKIEHGRAIGKIVFDKVNEFQ
jgi:NADPH:quinone reductase-like Zn-dependent oxidoreductase